MTRTTRLTHVRAAAISASTVFAVTLAIIAGLIFAWVVKKIWLEPKPRPPQAAPETRRLTVMATNLSNNQRVDAIHLKRITVSKEDYDRYVKKGESEGKGELLTGNQAVGRLTKEGGLTAEEPVYDNQVNKLTYPVSISTLLAPGKRAAIV